MVFSSSNHIVMFGEFDKEVAQAFKSGVLRPLNSSQLPLLGSMSDGVVLGMGASSFQHAFPISPSPGLLQAPSGSFTSPDAQPVALLGMVPCLWDVASLAALRSISILIRIPYLYHYILNSDIVQNTAILPPPEQPQISPASQVQGQLLKFTPNKLCLLPSSS